MVRFQSEVGRSFSSGLTAPRSSPQQLTVSLVINYMEQPLVIDSFPSDQLYGAVSSDKQLGRQAISLDFFLHFNQWAAPQAWMWYIACAIVWAAWPGPNGTEIRRSCAGNRTANTERVFRFDGTEQKCQRFYASYCTYGTIQNLRVTKSPFCVFFFFLLQCNLTPHQHLELFFISFGSVSEVIVQKPSRFNFSSSIFENHASATTMQIRIVQWMAYPLITF